jgi:vacuolar-type H+-ATPase subunit I/STV1
MKTIAKMTFVLAIGIFVLIAAGCEEEMSAVRKSRLVVLENEKIKKELESCQKENQQQKELLDKEFEKKENDLDNKIEKQKKLLEKEFEKKENDLENKIEKQKELLDGCLKTKGLLEEKTSKELQGQLDSILKDVVGENTRLRQENEGLKAE